MIELTLMKAMMKTMMNTFKKKKIMKVVMKMKKKEDYRRFKLTKIIFGYYC